MLYIVATPIGNIEDITFRAVRILKESDLILAEDTRRSSKLFKRYDISSTYESYNDMNKEKKTDRIVRLLKEDKEISLISDAGTPGISDPAYYLVSQCIKNDIQVSPVPGACAAISALVGSSLATDRFHFYGFLPKKEKKKRDIFNLAFEHKGTKIFYESPHRIEKTIKTLNELYPEKKIVIARELTKRFEEFLRGTAKELYEKITKKKIKGEIVLLIE